MLWLPRWEWENQHENTSWSLEFLWWYHNNKHKLHVTTNCVWKTERESLENQHELKSWSLEFLWWYPNSKDKWWECVWVRLSRALPLGYTISSHTVIPHNDRHYGVGCEPTGTLSVHRANSQGFILSAAWFTCSPTHGRECLMYPWLFARWTENVSVGSQPTP